MRTQIIRSALQKTTAIFVSCMMIASLTFPLSAIASESTTPNKETVPASSQPTPAKSSSPETADNTEATQGYSPANQPQPNTKELTSTQQPPPSQHEPPVATNDTTQSSEPQTSTNTKSAAPTTQLSAETAVSLGNTINSNASSGNATAHQNTTVGNVATGNAEALATIVNLLQSSVNLNGAQPITFIQDVTGTVNGDIIVDPEIIASLNTTSPLFTDTGASPSTNIDAASNVSITNTITLSAASGNATATENTTAGNVQSGSANAVANVVNIINSAIQANQSFVGMINIYGDLQGNILVPEEFINSVLGTGPATPQPMNGGIITTDHDSSVVNNVNATAQSGRATAANNSHTGAVSTGEAHTNVTILNLTSSQTIGKNALLVFVNVMGNWVGLILDAPAGTTSASLGGKATQTSDSSKAINSTANHRINNTVTASATSGSATATENTTVGNITSGNASAGVNLANILNSQISLSDWFGILFINVFGTWNGNFGVQTAVVVPPSGTNGGPNPVTNTGNGGPQPAASSSGGTRGATPAVFRFVPSGHRTYILKPLALNMSSVVVAPPDTQYSPEIVTSGQQSVLGTNSNSHAAKSKTTDLQNKDNVEEQGLRWWWLPILLLFAALIATRYYLAARHRKANEADEPIA